jgi:hypothetical protein
MGFKKGTKRNRRYATGKHHRRWIEGAREKECVYCKRIYPIRPKEPYSSFLKRKFCGKECIRLGQKRFYGAEHYNFRVDARRRNRGGAHHKWVNAVVNRDKATCQHCGNSNVELHAHHIKSYKEFPELRFDVANGLTLCFKCHWNLHAAQNEKAVNSVDTRPGNAEGNTEPSLQGNLLEGVTTRGRAFRRWVGKCEWCKTDISKRLSDTKGKQALFCGGSCRSKWIRKKVGPVPKAVTSSKSAARESEDIV